jgi:hypothetical protein
MSIIEKVLSLYYYECSIDFDYSNKIEVIAEKLEISSDYVDFIISNSGEGY